MPLAQQLFDSYIHHLSAGYGADSPIEADLGPGSCEDPSDP